MPSSFFEYHNPVKLVSGDGTLELLASELRDMGVSRPLVVTDRNAVQAGLVKRFKAGVAGSGGVIGALVDDVPSPASCAAVNAIAGKFRKMRCDGIVALGGGAVIDTAKGVAILAAEGGGDIIAYAGSRILSRPLTPLAVLPVSPGSGCEVAPRAVLGEADRNLSLVYESSRLVPGLVLLDPAMTLEEPALDIAAGGMHLLSNAMEAMTCIRRNPVSDAFAAAALGLAGKALIPGVTDPADAGWRLALANGSVMAGIAFSSAPGGAVHALARAAEAVAGVPPGLAMAVLLPLGLEQAMASTEAILAGMLLPLAGADEYARVPESRRAARLVESLRELVKGLRDLSGLPLTLAETGVPKQSLESMARLAVNDPAMLMNPREMRFSHALDLLERAYS
jgi:alcohol dehydrogenase